MRRALLSQAVATTNTIAGRARRAGGWTAALLGLSIPLSVALDNVLLAATILAWLLSGNLRAQSVRALGNPLVIAALFLFGLFFIGVFVYDGESRTGFGMLAKYKELLLLVPLVGMLEGELWRRRAFRFFFAAMALTLAGSYAIATGLLPIEPTLQRNPGNPTAFKLHITHNFLMAMFAFVCAALARAERDPRRKLAYIVIAVLAAINVLFMVHGRTGYIVLLALFGYGAIAWYRWRGLVAGLIIVAVVLGAGWFASSSLRERTEIALTEYRDWVPGEGASTSVGQRLDFYHTTLMIIREHPVLGVGTGGFSEAYARKVEGTNVRPSTNPHNEYLMIAAQSGIPGLLAFLAMLAVMWRLSGRLADPFQRDLGRALVISYALGNLVNSFLLDHTEGTLFCWAGAALYAGMSGSNGKAAA